MLLSNRVLVCSKSEMHGRDDNGGKILLRDAEYLVPFLFPEELEAQSGLYLLHWDEYRERHGRKYVFSKGVSSERVQDLILELCGVMRGEQTMDRHWNREQSIGAWQVMAGRKVVYECRREEGHEGWVLYVMLSATKESASLMKMIVRIHDVVFGFFFQKTEPTLYVALAVASIEFLPNGLRDWEFRLAREMAPDRFLELLPERLRGYEAVDENDRKRTMCIWCVAPSGQCTHSWQTCGYVATGYIGGGGQGHVLRGYNKAEGKQCAFKVAELRVCDWERRALEKVGGIAVKEGARVMGMLVQDAHATLTGPQNTRQAMILEWVDGKVISTVPAWSEHEVVVFLRAMCSLLMEVYMRGVVHLDLKPSNIMKDVVANGVCFVLIDFGACGIDDERRANRTGEPTPWISPELRDGAAIGDAASDVYSLGMIAFQMLRGWSDNDFVRARANLDVYSTLMGHCSKPLATLIGRMCCTNAKDRPSLVDILNGTKLENR